MDIAYYISDLLGQQGELSVPNLGYFVQIRMNAYYDEKAKTFFPPHYAVKFDPQVIDDDDTLASYITNLKKISLASAKYFIEKYISNLKSQVMIEDVPFATLGSFSSDGIKLSFSAGIKNDDPSFFAFTEIEAYKIGQERTPPPVKPVEKPVVVAAPVIQPPVAVPVAEPAINTMFAPVADPEEIAASAEIKQTAPQYTYEEEEAPARSLSIWIILLIVVTVLAIAFVAVYKLRPDLLKDMLPAQKAKTTEQPTAVPAPVKSIDTTINTPTPVTKDTIPKYDTVKVTSTTPPKPVEQASATSTPVKEEKAPKQKVTEQKVTTSAKPIVTATASAPVNVATEDTVPKGMWVIYSQAFPTKSGADHRIDVLKGKGFAQARLLKKKVGPGGNYKVILGAFKTKAEATSASQDIVTTGKVPKTDLSIELYK